MPCWNIELRILIRLGDFLVPLGWHYLKVGGDLVSFWDVLLLSGMKKVCWWIITKFSFICPFGGSFNCRFQHLNNLAWKRGFVWGSTIRHHIVFLPSTWEIFHPTDAACEAWDEVLQALRRSQKQWGKLCRVLAVVQIWLFSWVT